MLLLFIFLFPLTSEAKSLTSSVDKESPCSFQKGDYSLSWYYDDLSSDVVFKLTAKSQHPNFWSGFYMGEEQPTDAIGVFVRNGQIGLMDSHVSEDGVVADNLTDVQSLSFDLRDDRLTAEFARPLTPQDKSDADLAHCVTFFFPVVAPAIDMGSPVEVPKNMEKKRVCDIVDSCVARDQTSLVKREEPPLCEYKHGQQKVTWRQEEDRFVFVFDHPVKKGKWWSSVGAGDSMQEMSMMVAFAENGKVKTSKGFTSVGYTLPKEDKNNGHDIKLLSSSVKNNRAHYEISVLSDFIQEKTVGGCLTLQIAVNSGKYGANNKIQKHEVLPTAIPVCGIEHCGEKGKTTKKPNKKTTVAIIDYKEEKNDEEKQANGGIFDLKQGNEDETTVGGNGPEKNSEFDGEKAKEGEFNKDTIVDFHDSTNNETAESAEKPKETGVIVDVKPDLSEFNKDTANGESVVDSHLPREIPHGDAIVDVKTQEPNGGILEVKDSEKTSGDGSAIMDVRPEQNGSGVIVDVKENEEFNKDEKTKETNIDTNLPKEEEKEGKDQPQTTTETVIIGFREVPARKNSDGKVTSSDKELFNKDSLNGESIVDVHSQEDLHGETIIGFRERPSQKKATETILSFREVPRKTTKVPNTETKREEKNGEAEKADDLRIPADALNEKKRVNEAIIGIPTTRKPKTETIVDLNAPKELLANGTAEVLQTEEGGKTTTKPKTTTKADAIVDLNLDGKPTTGKPTGTTKKTETVEGSGQEDVVVRVSEGEGSGETPLNNNSKPDVGSNVDQTENSVINDLEPSSKNNGTDDEETGKKLVDSLLGSPSGEPTKPTTFAPPISVPQLPSSIAPQARPTAGIASLPTTTLSSLIEAHTLAASLTTPNPSSVAWVPKVCVSQDLRVCESYFADYLSKVAEWSSKHHHTVESSMWKACKLLSQVKHVPSMCCNRFKKECDAFSHQYV